jgi:uncharacterized protein YgbK (DUF1537 family)
VSKLLLAFYGDDFTGSTDALEQLTLAGIRSALFIEPPSPEQLKRFPKLQAIGVAGMTRSLAPEPMKRVLKPALKQLKALGPRHVHYKVCSTFDSSPKVGNLGSVLDVAAEIFRGPFVPLLVAAPGLGRYCAFGNLFARFGIGSDGDIHRLDRHPSVSRHPITPMTEADLRLHLAKQTKKRMALFDILKVALPARECRAALEKILADKPDVVLFDALYADQLACIGGLIDSRADGKEPLLSLGSSGIETALAAHWKSSSPATAKPASAASGPILAGSGSCSLVTKRQIAQAIKDGFAEVALDPAAFKSEKNGGIEIERATATAVKFLRTGRSVIVHTTGSREVRGKLKDGSAEVLGTALGQILRRVLEHTKVQRICIAGGDTSSFAARAMGIEALEMIAPLTPGAPLCRAAAQSSPVDGLEVVFKGGQVGGENYFNIVKHGKIPP